MDKTIKLKKERKKRRKKKERKKREREKNSKLRYEFLKFLLKYIYNSCYCNIDRFMELMCTK